MPPSIRNLSDTDHMFLMFPRFFPLSFSKPYTLCSKTQSFYTEGSESTSAIPVKSANKYFCVAAQQGEGGLSNTAIVFVLEISNDFKKANIAKIFATALSVSVKLNDGAVTFTFGSSYIKLLMMNIDHA